MTDEVYSIRHSQRFHASVVSSNQKRALNILTRIEKTRNSRNLFSSNREPTSNRSEPFEMANIQQPKSDVKNGEGGKFHF